MRENTNLPKRIPSEPGFGSGQRFRELQKLPRAVTISISAFPQHFSLADLHTLTKQDKSTVISGLYKQRGVND